jgi:TolA-binding protein
MQKKTLRNHLLGAAAFAVLLAAAPVPARAASKEIIELQTQVQQLLDSVQRLQSTMDKGFAVMQNLAQQTADNASQMTAAASALQQKIAAQSDATNSKLDTASGQVQSLNDSVDELKSRIAKLDKSIADLQAQLQNIQNPPAPAAEPASPAAKRATPAHRSSNVAPASDQASNPASDQSANPTANPTANQAANQAADQAPPLKETLQAGVRDYNAAKYGVAAGEFQDVIQNYPLDELAGTAQFYLGEIAYRQLKLTDAVKDYNAVLEGFPGNAKAPAAQLHKGLALLRMKDKKEAGITELRLLVKRHPQTPEAAQARAKLNALGAKPSAAHQDADQQQ